ncbi:thioredoxin family protein [Bizionia arctica]|uniref:DUF255 domain-containing protein n=1 Tax=Bizionia arctica TaxID=1495645 RepID=A0A917GBH5_9FLAO|nr:thioredoxin family protein [Bizionia arctica]GGG35714.1 hypothetical protein GCM10010976_04290 [Bizionia arctica]
MCKIYVLIFIFTWSTTSLSQEKKTIQWLSFEQLSDSLENKPKKVFIDFYADWCAPCLKMQREVFSDENVIKILNEDYYAIQMNVESTDTIHFGNQTFINKRTKKRNPVHEIPLLMASQKNKPFTLPALIFFDENFQATSRYFQYLNIKQFLSIISK